MQDNAFQKKTIKMRKHAAKIIGFLILFLGYTFSGDVFSADSNSSNEDSWKNFYGIAWRDTATNHAKYAKQMGYSSIVIKGYSTNNYRSNANLNGLKFFLMTPFLYQPVLSDHDSYINIPQTYSQSDIDFYNQNMVWKSNESFPNNLASGWFFSQTKFSIIWDFQQQAVIDSVVEKIISFAKSMQDASSNFTCGGYMIDVPKLSGDFWRWDTSQNKKVSASLSYWTGTNSGLVHGTITHEYATYSEGSAAFYKKLNQRMREEFPDAKWILDPYVLYNTNDMPDEWIYQIKDRSDKDELTPDMIVQEGPYTDFVDNSNNFNSEVNITKDMVGCSQRNAVSTETNTLIAAKAAINGAWYNWFGQWGIGVGAASDMPNFQSIADVYPRLKLIRCIPSWDNLNSVLLTDRSWDGSVYQSKKDGKLQSYISSDLMYSRHFKTGKLFVVFNTYDGVIKLNADEVVSSIQGIDGYFIESADASADMEITDNAASSLKEIKLKSSVSIPTDNTNSQIKGVGYIITIKTLPQATTNLAGNVKSGAAELNATVNANGSSASAWFEYGTTSGSYTAQTPAQTISGSSDTNVSDNISGLSEGKSYYYRIAAKNDAGTAYGNEISFSVADETAPSNGSISINNGTEAVNSTKVTLKLIAQDSLGVSGYYLSARSSIPAVSSAGWVSLTPATNYSSTISYTLTSGDGTKTLYCRFKDASGNISKAVNDSIILDTVSPVITITSPELSASTYSTKDSALTISGTASDFTSGVKAVSWSTGVGAESGTAEGTTDWSIANISLNQGDTTVTVSAQDKAGNKASVSFKVTYGLEPGLSVPEATNISATSATLTGSVNPNGLSTGAWFEYGTTSGAYTNQTPTQTISGSSPASISANISGLSEGKVYYYRMAAKNSSGTVYGSKMSFAAPDVSIPSGSISINNGSAAVNTPEVTLKLIAQDNIGVAGYYLSISYITPKVSDSNWVSLTPILAYSANIDYTLSNEDGTKTLYCWYKDAAGNISKVSSYSIILDAAPPSLSITNPAIEVGTAYYVTTGSISLKGTSRDETSGVKSISYSVNSGSFKAAEGTTNWSVSDLSLMAGENTFTFTVRDKADNSVSLSTRIIYGSAPKLTTLKAANIASNSAVLSGTVNPNYLSTGIWFECGATSGSYTRQTPAQIISGSSDTNISGNISGLSEGKNYYYRIAAKNDAGTAYGIEKTFKTAEAVDTSAPVGTISINNNAKHTKSKTVSLGLSAIDNKGVTGYYISTNNIAPSASASGWIAINPATNYSAKVSYVLSPGDGLKTVYCWYKDAAGNVSTTP